MITEIYKNRCVCGRDLLYIRDGTTTNYGYLFCSYCLRNVADMNTWDSQTSMRFFEMKYATEFEAIRQANYRTTNNTEPAYMVYSGTRPMFSRHEPYPYYGGTSYPTVKYY